MLGDLVVIAGLTQWIDQATAKLGKERTSILVEMLSAGGLLPQNLKDTLLKMAELPSCRPISGEQSITARDYLVMLAQLRSLLPDAKPQDNALLSMLSITKKSVESKVLVTT